MTRYPPTTFTVAAATATTAITVAKVELSPLVASSAPTIVIPEMAFEPDISGVWSCEGTLAMSSTPRKIEITKMKMSMVTVDRPQLRNRS